MSVYDRLKEKPINFNRVIKKDSDLLGESFYFRRLTGEEWQVIDAMRSQLAHHITSGKLGFKDAYNDCYVFELIKMTWVNKDGSGVSSDDDFIGLKDGSIDSLIVNELSRLALEANDFILTKESLEEKKKSLILK